MSQCPNGAMQQGWALARSGYDNEDEEKGDAAFRKR